MTRASIFSTDAQLDTVVPALRSETMLRDWCGSYPGLALFCGSYRYRIDLAFVRSANDDFQEVS